MDFYFVEFPFIILSDGVSQPEDGNDGIRGELAIGARRSAPQPCIRSIREDRTMMQSYASAAKLRGGGPILHSGLGKPWFAVGSQPPRIHRQTPGRGCQNTCSYWPSLPCRRSRRWTDDALRNLAAGDEAPEGDQQFARQRHDHRLARSAASISRSCRKPLGQATVLLEPEKTPSQLDHATPDAGVAGARKTPFASTTAALVGRPGKPGVSADAPPIP